MFMCLINQWAVINLDLNRKQSFLIHCNPTFKLAHSVKRVSLFREPTCRTGCPCRWHERGWLARWWSDKTDRLNPASPWSASRRRRSRPPASLDAGPPAVDVIRRFIFVKGHLHRQSVSLQRSQKWMHLCTLVTEWSEAVFLVMCDPPMNELWAT